MNDFMSKEDIVEMLEDYDCFSVIGYLAEAVARFDDYNTPMPDGLMRYSAWISTCADVTVTIMDHTVPEPIRPTICNLKAAKGDAKTLNEIARMVDYLAEQLTGYDA